MKKRALIYGRWAVAGIPIALLNFGVFKVVILAGVQHDIAWWSWVVVSPATYHIWKWIER